MQYLKFGKYEIPLSCITGLSYSKQGNIVDTSNLSCRCLGINNVQVQLQITISPSTCYDIAAGAAQSTTTDFIAFAREMSQVRPSKTEKPAKIYLGNDILLPQLEFMLISTNITYQSDRLGKLQEMQLSWTLSASRVVKEENRNTELLTKQPELLPKVTLYCDGKSIECKQDISIANLHLSGFRGTIELFLADTYTEVDRDAWLAQVNNSKTSYFEIEHYGKFYILSSNIVYDNWLSFDLTKFNKHWYKKQTKTFIADPSSPKVFTLKDIFSDCDDNVVVKSKAKVRYFKYDDTPYNVLKSLQDDLGYNIGLQGDDIILYDTPDKIGKGDITYDYVLDGDTLTMPITKCIVRDDRAEYIAGNDDGETYYVYTNASVTQDAANAVLKYVNFNQNMITLSIPYEPRIRIGSIINVNIGDTRSRQTAGNDEILKCVCTEYDIDFLSNSMQIELHYVERTT